MTVDQRNREGLTLKIGCLVFLFSLSLFKDYMAYGPETCGVGVGV